MVEEMLGNLLTPETAIWLEIGAVLVGAFILVLIARLFNQPLIPAYVFTGLILGPIGLGWIQDTHVIRALSEIGVAFLLFFVGLEMSLKKLKRIGKVATIAGFFQVLIIGLLAFAIALIFSFQKSELIFIALAIPFSSTAIVVKILSDKKELDTLHARIAIGMLLVQDIIAMIALTLLSSKQASFSSLVAPSLKTLLLIGIGILFSITISKPIFRFSAKSEEILILAAISTCFFFSLLAMLPFFGLPGVSLVIGFFIGGITLANSPYKIEIERNVRSLRDFFVTIFFVSIGLQLSFEGFGRVIIPAIIFTILVLFIEPYITMILVRISGYTKRTSFFSGFLQAQTSEFSLVLMTQGLILGLVTKSTFSMIVLITIISMSLTPFIVDYQNFFYEKLGRILNLFDKIPAKDELEYLTKKKKDIVLFGCHRMGSIFMEAFEDIKDRVIVIDYNPDVIDRLSEKKISCIYGDISSPDVLNKLNLKDMTFAVSTVPDIYDNEVIIKKIKKENKNTLVFVTANYIDEALELYEKGADYVILPQIIGGERGISYLRKIIKERKGILKERKSHIEYLKGLKEYNNTKID